MSYYFRCPKCKSDEYFVTPNEDLSGLRRRILGYGGLISYLYLSDHIRNRIQCGACGYIFRKPPLPGSPLSKLAIGFLMTSLLLILAGVLFLSTSESADRAPTNAVIAPLEAMVAAQPRIAAYLLALLFVLLVLPWAAVAFVSNWRYRKRLAAEHRVEPEPWRAFGDPDEPESAHSVHTGDFERR